MRLITSLRDSPRDALFAVAWVILMALILLSFGDLVLLPAAKIAACEKEPAHLVSPPVIIVASIVAFIIGSRIGKWRAKRFPHTSPVSLPASPPPPDRAAVLAFALLPLFFLLVAVLLAYETYALANGRDWPITSYVHCAYAVAPYWTAVAACSLAFEFGHWFW
jgi:hypothetical protein